jgi:hypothetical protein
VARPAELQLFDQHLTNRTFYQHLNAIDHGSATLLDVLASCMTGANSPVLLPGGLTVGPVSQRVCRLCGLQRLSMSIFVPVRHSTTGDCVEIELDNLPQDVVELIGVLEVRCLCIGYTAAAAAVHDQAAL